MSKAKVFTGVDLIKLFSAFGVIAIHTYLPFFNILGRLGVPFFAIVSSFFFFKKFNKTKKWTIQKSILLNFCKRIFLLYFTWQCIYIPLSIINIRKFLLKFSGIDVKTVLTGIVYFFFPALYNSKNINVTFDLNGWGPSWYLLAVMVGIPAFVLLLKIFNSNKLVIGFICVCLEVYFILANEFGYVSHFSPLLTHTFVRLFIYFFIGYILAIKYEKGIIKVKRKKNLFFILVLMIFLFVIENIVVHTFGGIYTSEEVITTVPTSIVLSLLSFNWNPEITNSVHIRNLSTFLYCIQIWPIAIIEKIFTILGLSDQYVMLFLLVVTVSIILYYVYIHLLKKNGQSLLKYMI